MKQIKNVTIGADPEVFFEDLKTNKIISAEGLIGGSKNDPKPLAKKGCFIQEDNIMAEYNIPPCNSLDDFIHNINYVRNHLNLLAKEHNAKLSKKSSSLIEEKYLNTKQAKMFGCDPDYNVYLQTVNDPVPSNTNFRSCGGHIHVGFNVDDFVDDDITDIVEKIVKAMDFTLGLESVILDLDVNRRTTYGKSGNFRFKSYGVEYRTLSNFWTKDTQGMKWAFEKTFKAIELVNSGLIDYLDNTYSNQVQKAINQSDVKLAKKLLDKITIKETEKIKQK